MKTLSSRLRTLRDQTTQTAFASLLETKQTSYSGWETGVREPSLDKLRLIATKCNVSTDWLLGLTDERSAKIQIMADPALELKNAELEAKLKRADGEIAGLRHALELLSKTK